MSNKTSALAGKGQFLLGLAVTATIAGLYWISTRDYLLFHGLVEIFSIAVAIAIFMLVVNAWQHIDNGAVLLLGTACLFIGMIDMVHTLAYAGMGPFPGYTANLPTQLWIAARYLQSLTLLAAPLLVDRKLKIAPLLTIYSGLTILLLLSIFAWPIFPDCFIPGQGLTPFKKISEYLICVVLGGAIYLFHRRRDHFDREMLDLLVAALILAIGAELAFTFYVSVYGLSNMMGHLFKTLSFYMIYRAVIGIGLKRPYDSLYKRLGRHKDELERANLRLLELDQLKSLFIASMSHELRTPLNSIIGFTGVILDGMSGPLTGRQEDQLHRVYRSSQHLLHMINDIIDISKIESGNVEVVVHDFSLPQLLGEATENIQTDLEKKGLGLVVEMPAELQMQSDDKRLFQCVLNLLSNAVKFTEAGTITVTATAADQVVTIAVRDTGIGIAAADQARLFQAFERITSPLAIKAGGTGLGLYLTKKLVTEMLGGKIEVSSTVGKGSTFTMIIPRDLTDNKQTGAARPAEGGTA